MQPSNKEKRTRQSIRFGPNNVVTSCTVILVTSRNHCQLSHNLFSSIQFIQMTPLREATVVGAADVAGAQENTNDARKEGAHFI
jgi:hypothetical protein